eukprot:COSAG03_NODE_17234_length_380_cov_1.459075_1_plen_44_part_10
MVRTTRPDPYRDIWEDETRWWVPEQLSAPAPGADAKRLSTEQLE